MTGPVTLASEGDTARSATPLLVLGSILLAIGISTGLAVLGMGAAGVLPALLFTGGGTWALLAGLKARRVAARLEPGVLDVPSAPLTLGSAQPARFRRLVRQGTADAVALEARLVLREWVRYTVGTDTRTQTKDLTSIPVPISRTFDGQHVAGELTLQIPPYPPTFESRNNRVRWLLHVDLTLADGFQEDSVIPIPVAPAVRRSDLGGTG